MANNNGIFNSALQGGTSVIASRWQYRTTSAAYAIQAARVVAFATQVDADIPADPTLSQADFDLMEAICSSWWDNRSSKVAVAGNYEPMASAIVAIWTQMRGNMLPPPAIPIPLDPGEVPMVLYDEAPGVIGYTDVRWEEVGTRMHFPIGVAASFGSAPSEEGAIRLSSNSNGGLISGRNNALDDNVDMMQIGGAENVITIGDILTGGPIDLMGTDGEAPYHLRVEVGPPSGFGGPNVGTSIHPLETAQFRGGLFLSTVVPTDASVIDGYGIDVRCGILADPGGPIDASRIGGELNVVAGSYSGAGFAAQTFTGGNLNLSAGGITEPIAGQAIGGDATMVGGTILGGPDGGIAGRAIVQGGDATDAAPVTSFGGNVLVLGGHGITEGGDIFLAGGNGVTPGDVELSAGVDGGGVFGFCALGMLTGAVWGVRVGDDGAGAPTLGVFNTAPIAQPVTPGIFTDASGGTPSGTLTLVADTGAASVNNNTATIVVWANDLVTNVIEALGLAA